MQNQPDRDESRRSREGVEAAWPYASMVGFGFFGADTPEGRRLAVRTTVALLVAVAAGVGLSDIFAMPVRVAAALSFVAAVMVIVIENVIYLRELDELSQLLQLKAMAFAYGCAMTVAASLFVIGVLVGPLPAAAFLSFVIIVEPLRGLALMRAAKRLE